MGRINNLLPYPEITDLWFDSSGDLDSAKALTLQQVNAFAEIVSNDESWNYLLSVFEKGRQEDAWLATDWPDGFDELLLCVPLCKLVDFECSKCTIGKRQENNSCAHDDSLFGYVSEIIKKKERQSLLDHIGKIKSMLINDGYKWNLKDHTIEPI